MKHSVRRVSEGTNHSATVNESFFFFSLPYIEPPNHAAFWLTSTRSARMAHDCLVQLGPSKRRNLKDTIRPLLKDRKMEPRESSLFAYCKYKKNVLRC